MRAQRLNVATLKVGDDVGVARFGSWDYSVHLEKVIKITPTQIVTQLERGIIEATPEGRGYKSEPKRFDIDTLRQRTSGYLRYDLWSLAQVKEQEATRATRHATQKQIADLEAVDWKGLSNDDRQKVLDIVKTFKGL
jgi:hypothetical protein